MIVLVAMAAGKLNDEKLLRLAEELERYLGLFLLWRWEEKLESLRERAKTAPSEALDHETQQLESFLNFSRSRPLRGRPYGEVIVPLLERYRDLVFPEQARMLSSQLMSISW